MTGSETTGESLHWHTPTEPPFRLAGLAWFEADRVYRRLPVEPDWPLPEAVDGLANCTAGGQIQFQTDSQRLAVRVEAPPAYDDDRPIVVYGTSITQGAVRPDRAWPTRTS